MNRYRQWCIQDPCCYARVQCPTSDKEKKEQGTSSASHGRRAQSHIGQLYRRQSNETKNVPTQAETEKVDGACVGLSLWSQVARTRQS